MLKPGARVLIRPNAASRRSDHTANDSAIAMRSITLSLLIFLVLISGCRTEREDIVLGDADELIVGQREVQDSSTRGVDPGNRTIVLSGFNGDIELRGSNDPTARLEFIRRARGATGEPAKEDLQAVETEQPGTADWYGSALTR